MIDAEALLARRCAPGDLIPLNGQGVYAYFALEPNALPGVHLGATGIVYVGMTEDGLDARNHFNHTHSGFSTLRRSLGAILKNHLSLTALPRGSGRSKSNTRCYRFTDSGEAALTEWMRRNLLCAQTEIGGHVGECERSLIAVLQPPLNLKGWRNLQAAHIKSLRAACAREAEQNFALIGAEG